MEHSNKYNMGIDVGGSHISCALIKRSNAQILEHSKGNCPIDADGSMEEIIYAFKNLIENCLHSSPQADCIGIGIAMPGPFDYEKGISKIHGVEKLESLLGVNFKQIIRSIVPLPCTFTNDAQCFALGEFHAGAAQQSKRTLVLTLGTGFGSTFLVNGIPQQIKGVGIPENGYLYNIPFEDSMADNYFSTRWFVNTWNRIHPLHQQVEGVKEIADLAYAQNNDALALFATFTSNLATFLLPWVQSFQPDTLVLGGSISKASPLFIDTLNALLISKLRQNSQVFSFRTLCSQLNDLAPIVGAAMNVKNKIMPPSEYRKTQQYLAPEKLTFTDSDTYNIYPAFPLGENKISQGAKALAFEIAKHSTVIMDGYVGVFWEQLVEQLDKKLTALGKSVRWFHADAALKSSECIDQMLVPYLGGDDPVFGKVTDLSLSNWFDIQLLEKITPDPSAQINIIVGCGASLAKWKGFLIYIDLPKNELQFRMRAQKANNLGATVYNDNKQTYKRFFFVDWKVLNEHKCELTSSIDLIVDEQRPHALLFMHGKDFREGLNEMSKNFFRCRPWFEPGAWGGSWMKDHIKELNQEVDNLAWSFELMVLENGIMFESDGYCLEVSFDFLMFNNYQAILGDCSDRFKYDFPIRFDFLDTINGGNLSVQCHPRNEYIQKEFNMPFTQDETYYILDSKGTAEVYLGFQEGVNPEAFHEALIASQENNEALDITKYVQKHNAKKHDLFLIPNGTVHASGAGNMVLEISSAPYIFTFKMYDWMRLDLDGKPRPINIEHGMKNLYFDRQGAKVQKELICHPYVIEETKDYQLEHLPTHPQHFYDVFRYHFEKTISIECNNKCHVWMLVEGESVILKTKNGMKQRFHYAETFVIPAHAQSYTITNHGKTRAMMVMSYVK